MANLPRSASQGKCDQSLSEHEASAHPQEDKTWKPTEETKVLIKSEPWEVHADEYLPLGELRFLKEAPAEFNTVMGKFIIKPRCSVEDISRLEWCLREKSLLKLFRDHLLSPEALVMETDFGAKYVLSPLLAYKVHCSGKALAAELSQGVLLGQTAVNLLNEIWKELRIVICAGYKDRKSISKTLLAKLIKDNKIDQEEGKQIFARETRVMRTILGEIAQESGKYQLKHLSAEYFQNFYQQSEKREITCEFYEKRAGVQIGATLTIRAKDTNAGLARYYIKTHALGTRSGISLTAQEINPAEMFFYKLFEYTGDGPKVHFYYDREEPGAFFIATRDVGFTRKESRYKFFATYEKAMADLSLLEKFVTSTAIAQKQMSVTGADARPDPILMRVRFNFDNERKAILRMHILGQLLGLGDLLTNSGNFGYSVTIWKKIKWQIVDFSLFASVRGDVIWDSLCWDYGEQLPDFIPMTLYDTKYAAKRKQWAREIIAELREGGKEVEGKKKRKMNFRDAAEKAFDDVSALYSNYPKTRDKHVTLTSYLVLIMDEFQYLCEACENDPESKT